MEQLKQAYRLPTPVLPTIVQANLARQARRGGMNQIECLIFAFAAMLLQDHKFDKGADALGAAPLRIYHRYPRLGHYVPMYGYCFWLVCPCVGSNSLLAVPDSWRQVIV